MRKTEQPKARKEGRYYWGKSDYDLLPYYVDDDLVRRDERLVGVPPWKARVKLIKINLIRRA